MELNPIGWDPFTVLDYKLRDPQRDCNDKQIGNIKLSIAIALEVIHRLDVVAESRSLSSEESGLHKLLKRKLLGLCSLERLISR